VLTTRRSTHDFLKLGFGVWSTFCSTFELHAFRRKCALFLVKIPCTCNFGDIGEDEISSERNRQRNDTVDDEQPLPASKPPSSVEVVDGSHQVAGEHAGDGRACVEDAGSFSKLVAPIPRANDILHSGIKGRFGQADEESQRVYRLSVVGAREAKREDGPDKL